MSSGEAKKSRSAATSVDDALSFARVASVEPKPTGRMIPVARIIVRNRLRPVDPSVVEAKRVSMRESGQIAPLLVRPEEGRAGWYVLVVGAHRLEAARLEGWSDIEADIRHLTDDQAELVEIDENLIGPALTPLDRAIFIDARLKVWARLHPDRVSASEDGALRPKRGRPANSTKFGEFLGDTPPTMGFSAETASDLGLSEMTIKNALLIARGISSDVRARVYGTKIAKNEGVLRQLAGVANKAEQLRVAEALVGEKAKSFPDALVIAQGREPSPPPPPRPVDETLKALEGLWNKAPATHRAAMLHWLSGKPMPGKWAVVERADG